MAMGLWKLIFSQNEPPILEHWIEFLEEHPSIRGIPRDTWDMFLNFVEQVGDDLSTHEEESKI
jgi:DCN1-like protein 3